jgi:hypothetical protein
VSVTLHLCEDLEKIIRICKVRSPWQTRRCGTWKQSCREDMVEGNRRRSEPLWVRAGYVAVITVGFIGLGAACVMGLLVIAWPNVVANHAWLSKSMTTIFQAGIGSLASVTGSYFNELFVKGKSPVMNERRDFVKIVAFSQILTIGLSIFIQPRADALAASIGGATVGAGSAQLLRGAQIWGGALLAYIRNLIQSVIC